MPHRGPKDTARSDNGDRTNGDRTKGGPTKENGGAPRGPSKPFFFNDPLLAPDCTIPLPIIVNVRVGFQAVVRDLLVRIRAPVVTVEAAAVTAGAMLYGCQEYIAGCHDLIAAENFVLLRRACDRILHACREFSGSLDGLYVLVQAVEVVEPVEEEANLPKLSCSRLKNLSEHLEDFFAAGHLDFTMDLERLGFLQVHLDEVFDQCSRQLERFYHAARHRNVPQLFANFAKSMHHDVLRRIVPDHIYDPVNDRPAGGDERNGLLDLVSELAESTREPS